MNNKSRLQRLRSPVIVTVLSIIGFLQFSLVMFGWLYLVDRFGDAYPFLQHLRSGGMIFGWISLIYPVYILMAMELPQNRTRAKAKEQLPAAH